MQERWENLSAKKKYGIVGLIIALALMIPLGRWVYGMSQDAADRREAMEIEKKYAANRQPGANGAAMAGAGGGYGGGRRGGGQWGGGPGGEGRGEAMHARMMAEMTKEVGLSPTQAKQIQAIQASSRPLMADLFRNPKLSRDEKRAQMQQLRAAQQQELAKVLTTDQQTRYTAFQQKMREQFQSRRRERGGGGYGGSGDGGRTNAARG